MPRQGIGLSHERTEPESGDVNISQRNLSGTAGYMLVSKYEALRRVFLL